MNYPKKMRFNADKFEKLAKERNATLKDPFTEEDFAKARQVDGQTVSKNDWITFVNDTVCYDLVLPSGMAVPVGPDVCDEIKGGD